VAIDAQCPHCRKLLRAPEKKAGRQVNCPHCQQPIIVPEKPATIPTLQSAEVQSQAPYAPAEAEKSLASIIHSAPSLTAAPPQFDDATTQGAMAPSPLYPSKSNGALLTIASIATQGAVRALPRAAPLSRPADAGWYMRTPDEQQYGPVKRHALDQWVEEGRVDSDCQILCDGWQQWQWASDVYPQLGGATVPPPEFSPIGSLGSASLQVETAPAPAATSSARPNIAVAETAALPTRSGIPPPLPASTLTAYTSGETNLVSPPDALSRRVERAWIVTGVGLAIANVALWITLSGVAALFVSHLLSQTLDGPAVTNIVGAMFLWTIYGLVAAQVVLMTSWCVCLATPQQSAAKGWIQGAVIVPAVGLVVAMFISILAMMSKTGAQAIVTHLPAALLTIDLSALACFALFLGKLGNFFGDVRLSHQGALCAGLQAVVLAWSLIAMYVLGTGTDSVANIMRSAVTAALFGGNAVWLGILVRRARMPLKLL